MSKVICDICGTVYPENADSCPICGCSRDYGVGNLDEDFLLDEEMNLSGNRGKGGRFASAAVRRKNKEIFDYDEVNADEDEDEDEEEPYDDEESYVEEPKSNTALVVILVVLIVLLLLATGFVFFRYFMPNVFDTEEATVPTVTEAPTETTAETTEPTIPCQMLVLTSDAAELNKEGQLWLLHVSVTPEDTTDELIFVSEDESIATVSEDGRITAVGEGETVINIICGEQSIPCPVIVDYDMVIEETTAEDGVPSLEVEQETEASTDATDASGASEETEATAASDETQATEATGAVDETQTTEATAAPDAVLKLTKTDITLRGWGVTHQLQLEGDIKPEDVEWITLNSAVAIVHDGLVTVLGTGTTKIIGTYGDQTVECIVRCII